MSRPASIFIAIRPALYHELFTAAAQAQLRELADLTLQATPANLSSAELAHNISGHDIVITGWGTPIFTPEVLAAADRLQLIAHAAGTIKRLLPPPVFAAERRVTHAAAAMAIPVAETTLLFILLSLRHFHKIDRAFHDQGWATAKALPLGGELAGARIGVIGAGYTGRAIITRLQALDAEPCVYDPYLSEADATALGLTRVSLESLMRNCPIVTLQAPSTTETYRMIGAEQLRWLPDGATLINTARAHLIDEAALLAELQSGRINAALDVFAQEPQPDDSPFRALNNVILTPHVASHTRETHFRQGQIITDEVRRFLGAGELRYEVTLDMLETMA